MAIVGLLATSAVTSSMLQNKAEARKHTQEIKRKNKEMSTDNSKKEGYWQTKNDQERNTQTNIVLPL